ncbi:hypothetical protein GEV33_002298 [Tenebrio molitor]|uniref:Uncharacterized protein n=1 Tax=Tenebrio molitor TaxID=7067 RepID=A0A8J6LIU9_TENMO|nr:hypothetical protein GEV33_002298 [Tenebrio molitor]
MRLVKLAPSIPQCVERPHRQHPVGKATKEVVALRVESETRGTIIIHGEVVLQVVPPPPVLHPDADAAAVLASVAVEVDPSGVQQDEPPQAGEEQVEADDQPDEAPEGDHHEPGRRRQGFVAAMHRYAQRREFDSQDLHLKEQTNAPIIRLIDRQFGKYFKLYLGLESHNRSPKQSFEDNHRTKPVLRLHTTKLTTTWFSRQV